MGHSIPVVGNGYTLNFMDGLKYVGGTIAGGVTNIDYQYIGARRASYNNKVGTSSGQHGDLSDNKAIGIVTDKPSGIEINYNQLDQSADYIIKY